MARGNYDVVIIDGAPRVNDLGRSAILASDLVLIPVQPSPYDVWAAADTVQLIREAQQMKESLKAAFVVNRRIARTAIGRDAAAALAQFEESGSRRRAQSTRRLRRKRGEGAFGDRGRAEQRGGARSRRSRPRGLRRKKEESGVSKKMIAFTMRGGAAA